MVSTVENDENNVSAESQPTRCKSVVWEHFTKEYVSAGCTRALCKQCKHSFAYINGAKCNGTSHLKRHIGVCLRRKEGRNSQNTPYTPENAVSGSASNPSRKCRGRSFIPIPSENQDSGMMGRIGAGSELQPLPLSMRSPTRASNQSLAVTQQEITKKESRSCEANAVFIEESLAKDNENDIPTDSVNALTGKALDIINRSSCFTVKTETIESFEVVQLVKEPMEATMKMSSAKCPSPTAVDVNPFPTMSTSISVQERVEGFELVDNFRIPKEYAILYKKIYEKYGHMATKKVIKLNDDILLACTISLLGIISEMKTLRGEEVSVVLLERWEGFIKDAETLEFNIKWLREGFNRVKNHWRSSFNTDKEVESHVQVLDAMQVKYDDLCTSKGVYETALSEVKIQISKTEAKISCEREAIQEKLTQKHNFQNEPVSRWL
ncbi:hypothetical protein MKX01_018770 [Papaver californicum]|nr:hypothetical protein MKX01_018770 [Papaver californicum]